MSTMAIYDGDESYMSMQMREPYNRTHYTMHTIVRVRCVGILDATILQIDTRNVSKSIA